MRFNNERELQELFLSTDNIRKSSVVKEVFIPFATKGYNVALVQAFPEFEVGDAGRIDILATHLGLKGCDISFHIHVIELKYDTLTIEALNQVLRYRHFVEKWAEASEISKQYKEQNIQLFVHCHLVGQSHGWKNNAYYVMRLLEEYSSFNIHVFQYDPFSGFVFKSTDACEDYSNGKGAALESFAMEYLKECNDILSNTSTEQNWSS